MQRWTSRLLAARQLTTSAPPPSWLPDHLTSPQATPNPIHASGGVHSALQGESPDAIRRRRILFRARQRGWLELDVLLGHWTSKNVHGLSEEELGQLEDLLRAETPDLYRWIVQMQVPDDVDGRKYDNNVFRKIVQFAHGSNGAK